MLVGNVVSASLRPTAWTTPRARGDSLEVTSAGNERLSRNPYGKSLRGDTRAIDLPATGRSERRDYISKTNAIVKTTVDSGDANRVI